MCGTPKEGEPVLDCSDRSYKLAHKSECCPTASLSDTDCWNCNNKMSIYEPAPEQERLCVLQAGPDPSEVFLQWYSSPTMGVAGIVDPSSWCNVNQELGYLTLCPDKNIVENTLCTEPDGAKVCVIPNKAGYNAYNPTYSSGGYIYESQGCGIGGNSRNCMIEFKVMVCKEYSPCTGNGW